MNLEKISISDYTWILKAIAHNFPQTKLYHVRQTTYIVETFRWNVSTTVGMFLLMLIKRHIQSKDEILAIIQ